MAVYDICPRCGVPLHFVTNHLWLGGGVIVQNNNQGHRMVLMECDSLDPLFEEIGNIIGVPIERMVIEAKRRAARDYIGGMLPPEVKEMIGSGQIGVAPLIEGVNLVWRGMGLGDPRLIDIRYEDDGDDFVVEHVRRPYSVPLWCGDLAGLTEALTSREHEVACRTLPDDVLEIKAWCSPRPPELRSRLRNEARAVTEGNIELKRCPACGGPAALTSYRWNSDKGVIRVKGSGRRIAMIGAHYLEAVFRELVEELGEEIPRAVVEAQRRFSNRTKISSTDEITGKDDFREILAVRGFGNLREMGVSKRGVTIRIENATPHLIMVGLMQSYFEQAAGAGSRVEWELGDDGTLDLEIAPSNQ